jgi:hypothetical protein
LVAGRDEGADVTDTNLWKLTNNVSGARNLLNHASSLLYGIFGFPEDDVTRNARVKHAEELSKMACALLLELNDEP